MKSMFENVKKFVNKSFENSVTNESSVHYEKTVYWVKKLKPEADEPILIAAYAHDIQRAFRKTNTEETFKNIEMNDPNFLKMHSEQGAKIISDFLRENNYDESNVERVYKMVKNHETGGDEESNLVKDADSLSYFECNAVKHVRETSKVIGKEKIKNKIMWMFNRITSQNAKKIAEPFYKKYLKLLDSL
ncbi:DUF4202 family protein [Candidatus Pacearchaeota archaeon]|nr:DUF4202 family protein [Candidatus Pacearchaeota archaeon]MBD3283793.1 DUF4202 family protein [Candidatus Pacearchaeota archaeon]